MRSIALAVIVSIALVSTAYGADVHSAALLGGLAKVRALVEKDPSVIRAVDASGSTPLHYAAAWDRKEVVAYLLARGAPLEAGDAQDQTPDGGRWCGARDRDPGGLLLSWPSLACLARPRCEPADRARPPSRIRRWPRRSLRRRVRCETGPYSRLEALSGHPHAIRPRAGEHLSRPLCSTEGRAQWFAQCSQDVLDSPYICPTARRPGFQHVACHTETDGWLQRRTFDPGVPSISSSTAKSPGRARCVPLSKETER